MSHDVSILFSGQTSDAYDTAVVDDPPVTQIGTGFILYRNHHR